METMADLDQAYKTNAALFPGQINGYFFSEKDRSKDSFLVNR